MKMKNVFSFFLGLCLLSSILSAAVLDEEPQQAQQKRRSRARENIIDLRLLRMTRVLELTEEQTAKIFPIVTRVEREKMAISRQIGKEMRELRLALRSESPDEKMISSKVKAVKELRDRLLRMGRELEASLEKNMTLIQRAKYLIFSADFNRDLRDQLGRARTQIERLQKKKKKAPQIKK